MNGTPQKVAEVQRFYERKVAVRGLWEIVWAWLKIMVGCNHHCEREEGNAHSPPDIHYSKEPNKGKRLMRRRSPSQEPAGKAEAEAAENNSAGGGDDVGFIGFGAKSQTPVTVNFDGGKLIT